MSSCIILNVIENIVKRVVVKLDVNAITSLISSLGFPIVGCGALFWRMNKQDAQHKEEVDKLSLAITNNSIVMQKLVDVLNIKEV